MSSMRLDPWSKFNVFAEFSWTLRVRRHTARRITYSLLDQFGSSQDFTGVPQNCVVCNFNVYSQPIVWDLNSSLLLCCQNAQLSGLHSIEISSCFTYVCMYHDHRMVLGSLLPTDAIRRSKLRAIRAPQAISTTFI